MTNKAINEYSIELVNKISNPIVKTLSDVVSSEFTPICYVDKSNPQELRIAITQMIGDVVEFLGPKNSNIEPNLALQLAELIIEEYNDIPVESLKIFFRNIKMGKYGKTYNSLSCADFMLWFKEFYQEYWNKFYEHKEDENQKIIKQTDDAFTDFEAIERIQCIFSGKKYLTPEERVKRDRIDEIRKYILKKNTHLYDTMSVEDANRTIDNEIKVALMAEGIFE